MTFVAKKRCRQIGSGKDQCILPVFRRQYFIHASQCIVAIRREPETHSIDLSQQIVTAVCRKFFYLSIAVGKIERGYEIIDTIMVEIFAISPDRPVGAGFIE